MGRSRRTASSTLRAGRSVPVATALFLVVIATTLTACSLGSISGDDAGGTLTVACQPPANLDPHFATTVSEELINHQIYDWLVTLDEHNEPTPDLATAWEMSADGQTWTFTIREGVKFSNGSPLTVDDILYSFKRMCDPKVGAPTSSLFFDVGGVASSEGSHSLFSLFAGILKIESTDSSHVVFHLSAADPDFVKDVADYHAVVISRSVKDPAAELVGTGPFMVKKYVAGDRMFLVKNPYYWGKAEDGAQLPYLDGVTFVFSDEDGQVKALREGRVEFVGGLSSERARQIQREPGLKLLTTRSNFHFLVHMRCDGDYPAADPRVRLALRMGTDYEALVDGVRPGLSTVGNGTVVGPTYGSYYWDHTPRYDPDGARKLLAEAGHAKGLTIKLHAVQNGDAGAFAVAWKKQMARIGVKVDIESVPADVYYSKDPGESWMDCEFGVTDWADRATPVAYFNLAYVSGGLYNESHWSDAEFDALTLKINRELDTARRAELYQRAQQILWERGPVVVFGHEDSVAGVSARIEGMTQPTDWGKVLFREAHFVK